MEKELFSIELASIDHGPASQRVESRTLSLEQIGEDDYQLLLKTKYNDERTETAGMLLLDADLAKVQEAFRGLELPAK